MVRSFLQWAVTVYTVQSKSILPQKDAAMDKRLSGSISLCVFLPHFLLTDLSVRTVFIWWLLCMECVSSLWCFNVFFSSLQETINIPKESDDYPPVCWFLCVSPLCVLLDFLALRLYGLYIQFWRFLAIISFYVFVCPNPFLFSRNLVSYEALWICVTAHGHCLHDSQSSLSLCLIYIAVTLCHNILFSGQSTINSNQFFISYTLVFSYVKSLFLNLLPPHWPLKTPRIDWCL